jgi:hypothetical protein
MGQGNQSRQTAAARDQYRGRADAGRQDLARGGAGGAGAGNRAGNTAAGGGSFQNRGGANAGNRAGGGAGANSGNRAGTTSGNRGGSSGGSFSGVDRGGSQAKAASQRGQSSRSSSASSGSRSSGSRSSGASRSGGGGSRGGGGGSRGGGGGGGRGRSDVALKENFAFVDPYSVLQRVLDMPISSWNYIDDPQSRHLGPMAQDFHYAFGLGGEDDKTITFLDEGGVALAAIQGLNLKLDERDAQIRSLQEQVAELKALVQELARKSGTEVGSSK